MIDPINTTVMLIMIKCGFMHCYFLFTFADLQDILIRTSSKELCFSREILYRFQKKDKLSMGQSKRFQVNSAFHIMYISYDARVLNVDKRTIQIPRGHCWVERDRYYRQISLGLITATHIVYPCWKRLESMEVSDKRIIKEHECLDM
uniref:Mitochondrial inner membrane protease subunit 2-like n=1 Tax=Crassostrea virginica TaxID=6565 RepID=A0A8B8B2Q6_CRAVI|nr:mitochondrial inner membrane protease subunit 2-like [Crassostrea virginica]